MLRVYLTVLIYVGLILGSFAGAQVWRLRYKQLLDDKKYDEDYDKSELKRLSVLNTKKEKHDRSKCLHCGHVLAWYDLLPLFSWLSTGGKCRYCRKPIGWFEPVIELATAFLFGLSTFVLLPGLDSGLSVAMLVLWLVACVLLVILFAYDFKWYLLPDSINFGLIGVAVVIAALKLFDQQFSAQAIVSLLGALIILPGLYWLLYAISKGLWIGFGDVKLCIGLALLLGRWELAFMTLFLANFIGTLLVLPFLASGKLSGKAHIPFGPLLIIATIIAVLFGDHILRWFEAASLAIFV